MGVGPVAFRSILKLHQSARMRHHAADQRWGASMTRVEFQLARRRVLFGAAGALLAPSVVSAADRWPLTIEVDSEQAPELAGAGEEIQRRAQSWWRIINEELASPGYRPPDVITLRFTSSLPDRLAGRAVGTVIELNAPYVAAHPISRFPQFYNFAGHELVHVVQAYPRQIPWLTEGIADYVRYYVLFPQDRERLFNPAAGDFRRGYQQAAALLDYVERTHGVGSVKRLNAALRDGQDGERVLADLAGMSLDDTWAKVLDAVTDGSPVPRA